MIKGIKNNSITIIVILIIMITNVGAYFSFDSNVNSDLKTQRNNNINTLVEETEEFFNLKMDERLTNIKALALFISTFEEWEDDKIMTALSTQAEVEGYTDYDIIGSKGIGLAVKGSVDYSENQNFIKALAGKDIASESVNEFGAIDGVDYFVSLKYGEDIKGVLKISSSLEQFSDFIDLSELSSIGSVFVVKQDGTLVSRGDGLDEVTNIRQVLDDDKATDKLISNMKTRKRGNVTVTKSGNKKYFGYARCDYNKWYVISIISSSSVEAKSNDIKNEGKVFFMQIAFLFVVLVFYFIYTLVAYNNVSKVNKIRYILMSDMLEAPLFDYSVKKNSIYLSEKWEQIFGHKFETEDPKEDMLKYVYEEDKKIFEEKIQLLEEGTEKVHVKVRLLNSENNPIECTIRMFAISAGRGKLAKVIGVVDFE